MKVFLPIAPPAYSQQSIQRANFEIARAFEQADARYLSQEGGPVTGDVRLVDEARLVFRDPTNANNRGLVYRSNTVDAVTIASYDDDGNNVRFFNFENGTNSGAERNESVLRRLDADARYVRSAGVPASAGATGTAGQIAYDTDYIYVCVATNTWKRAALSTW